MVASAVRHAITGKPGPVYLDMPGDVLYKNVDEATVFYREPMQKARPQADKEGVHAAIKLLSEVQRPILAACRT